MNGVVTGDGTAEDRNRFLDAIGSSFHTPVSLKKKFN